MRDMCISGGIDCVCVSERTESRNVSSDLVGVPVVLVTAVMKYTARCITEGVYECVCVYKWR